MRQNQIYKFARRAQRSVQRFGSRVARDSERFVVGNPIKRGLTWGAFTFGIEAPFMKSPFMKAAILGGGILTANQVLNSERGVIVESADIMFSGFGAGFGSSAFAMLGGAVMPGLGHVIGWAAGALIGGGLGSEVVDEIHRAAIKGHSLAVPTFRGGNKFIDSEMTYTMRQRAVAAIQKSHMNARFMLGNEARIMHV